MSWALAFKIEDAELPLELPIGVVYVEDGDNVSVAMIRWDNIPFTLRTLGYESVKSRLDEQHVSTDSNVRVFSGEVVSIHRSTDDY